MLARELFSGFGPHAVEASTRDTYQAGQISIELCQGPLLGVNRQNNQLRLTRAMTFKFFLSRWSCFLHTVGQCYAMVRSPASSSNLDETF